MSSVKNESKLSDHKRNKKDLIPPLLQIENLSHLSWINDRVPEMLWAVLSTGNLDREKYIKFIRHTVKFIEKNPDCYDLTITGISKFEQKKRKQFLSYLMSWSPEIKNILRPLILFSNLPAFNDWNKLLDKSDEKEDWNNLSKCIVNTFDHQSQNATDCRWVIILSHFIAGKLKVPEEMKDFVEGIFYYPNKGNKERIGAEIRSTEIALAGALKDKRTWSTKFWKECLDKTDCYPEYELTQERKKIEKYLENDFEKIRKKYIDSTREVRNKLIDHFLNTIKTSDIDPRHEGAFGLTFYAITIFIEILLYSNPFSISARLILRSLVETQITFTYLLEKEKDESKIWEQYRVYGNGKAKLIYLKLKDLKEKPSSIDIKKQELIANEDKWMEYLSINLGNWESTNLRKMSEEIGLKELYDHYYDYTSGYIHANWESVRESIYQRCINPLHRFHKIPNYELPLLNDITMDALDIINNILECLSKSYPKFEYRLPLFNKK